jgi:hypothetical protein
MVISISKKYLVKSPLEFLYISLNPYPANIEPIGIITTGYSGRISVGRKCIANTKDAAIYRNLI